MMKRRALGKGLGSLLPEIPPAAPAEGLRFLDTQAIVPNRLQPRENFDGEELKALAESIKRDGLLQPILVRPSEGGYEIVAGERRWRAAILAGLKRIPSMIQSMAEDRSLELALVENLQRRDLDAIEEARAFRILADKFGMTQEEISERVGKSRPTVANALRLLKLPPDVQELIKTGALTRGHARALLALEGADEIRKLADRLIDESMNVRLAEAAARSRAKGKARGSVGADPNVRAAQDRLQSRLGTQVRIVCNAKGKGKIEIGFGSHEELSRLFDGLITARF